jgi:hypothetical protein
MNKKKTHDVSEVFSVNPAGIETENLPIEIGIL